MLDAAGLADRVGAELCGPRRASATRRVPPRRPAPSRARATDSGATSLPGSRGPQRGWGRGRRALPVAAARPPIGRRGPVGVALAERGGPSESAAGSPRVLTPVERGGWKVGRDRGRLACVGRSGRAPGGRPCLCLARAAGFQEGRPPLARTKPITIATFGFLAKKRPREEKI